MTGPMDDGERRAVIARMKTLLLLTALLAFPVHGEVRAAARGGVFAGAETALTGSIELEARIGRWSFSPSYEVIRGGHGLYAIHADVRHLFQSEKRTVWIGAGPTLVRAWREGSSETTWNVDIGAAWRLGKAWEPFVAARYYEYHLPVFRDSVEGNGAVISVGVSRKLF